MPTRPCDLVPLEPIFYVVKFGFAGIYIYYFSKFCSYNRLWILVSLESPQPTIYVLSKNKKLMTSFHLKTVILQRLNRNILPRRVNIICQELLPMSNTYENCFNATFFEGCSLKNSSGTYRS